MDRPKQRYVADLKEINVGLQSDGYRYLLNIVDAFSKYSWSFIIKDKKAETIHKYFQKVINDKGTP